ncbi:uncharacterized protein PITG_02249 [Phytophthora infestans T30-4]|uniref:Uncharacterized protein n=1 Tax=Phytophthora infestans (strain T30-4) TaxID=403677 RepID=D0MVV0_PHYIT|nr:uncharacterized protein PITG_02249 [Phytophthora infestans T30-4]EEY63763.1 hypothetical protein PITG_02249 [Phytophthora infestans T30-4]|eukprot:XP_002907199.1 hypothetical protein PITG_02249 [Phytophthora infestans T30-4]
MAARYEMIQFANRHEKQAKEACEQRNIWEFRAHQAEAELATNKKQLEEAFQRLEASNETLSSAKASIVQLQGELMESVAEMLSLDSRLRKAHEKLTKHATDGSG